MPDSVQLAVLKALTVHLEGVTDPSPLAGAVFRGRGIFGADDPETMLSILEDVRPDERPLYATDEKLIRTEQWKLLLQGWTKDDKRNPSDPVYALKAAVEARLAQIVAVNRNDGRPSFPDVYLLGKLIVGLAIGPGIIRPPETGVSPRCFFYLPLSIRLSVDLANPYING